MLTQNLGIIDRTIRVLAGGALVVLVFVGPQTPWGWLGLVPLLTGLIGFCPAYCPLGLETCGVPRQ